MFLYAESFLQKTYQGRYHACLSKTVMGAVSRFSSVKTPNVYLLLSAFIPFPPLTLLSSDLQVYRLGNNFLVVKPILSTRTNKMQCYDFHEIVERRQIVGEVGPTNPNSTSLAHAGPLLLDLPSLQSSLPQPPLTPLSSYATSAFRS